MTPSFSSRLTPLSDGRSGLRSGLTITASAPPPEESASAPCLDFLSSDDTLDRYHEVISPAGWHLENYLRNPVFQNSHQYGDILFTLGKALITEVRSLSGSPALFQRILFATEANPMAKIAHALYRDGFLKAVSVGFVPIRWEDGSPDSPYTRRFLEQELLEISAVSIPANPNALALGLKSGSLQKTDLLNLSDLLSSLVGTRFTATQPSTLNPQLLQFARSLRALLSRA